MTGIQQYHSLLSELRSLGFGTIPGESRSDFQETQLGPRLNIRFRVQVILLRRPASKVQKHLSNILSRRLLQRSFLDEPMHWGDARPGGNHHNRNGLVSREVERVRRPHSHLDFVPWFETIQVRRTNAHEFFVLPGQCGGPGDTHGKGNMVRVPDRRRRDRVLSDSHGREHPQELNKVD